MIQETAFYVWLLSLNIMCARCTHLSVLFCGWIIFHYMDIPHLFTHCLVAGHLWSWGWESVNQLPELPTTICETPKRGTRRRLKIWREKKKLVPVSFWFPVPSQQSSYQHLWTSEAVFLVLGEAEFDWIQFAGLFFFFLNACRPVLSNFLEDTGPPVCPHSSKVWVPTEESSSSKFLIFCNSKIFLHFPTQELIDSC